MNKDITAFLREIEIARGFSAYTVKCYACDIYGLHDFLHNKNIDSWEGVSRDVLLKYFECLKRKNFKPASLQRKAASFKSFFEYLVKEKTIQTTPAFELCPSRAHRSLPNVLSIEQIDSLIRAAAAQKETGLRDAAIIEMLYSSGVRVGELVKIRCGQLQGDFLRVTGKGQKEREVFIGEPAYLAAIKYLGSIKPKGKNEILFAVTERTVENVLMHASLLANIDPPATPHTIRHTFATHFLQGGADLREVQEALGHANVQTTVIYTHLSRESKRRKFIAAHPRSKLKLS